MTSAALSGWQGPRSDLLDQLIQAHTAVGGSGAGRRWATSELNRALLLRVAAQFQGFAKDFHAETAITFGTLSHPGDPKIASAISVGLQTNRELDRANAQPDSLRSDFSRFGIVFWDEMDQRDSRTPARREHFRSFNTARNALAHDDPTKLAKVIAQGYRIDLTWIRRWRRTLDCLASTMDQVMADHLARLFNAPQPW